MITLFEPTSLRVADTRVAPVQPRDVREFCQRFHYTGTGGSMLWSYGLWSGAGLLGVVSYNNSSRTACAGLFGEEGAQHVWHMGRLACLEDALPNSESRLIGGSLRIIAREHPDVWAVLTFAAIAQGHVGYVYQATNALYTGIGGNTGAAANGYVDAEGRAWSRRQWKGNVTPEQVAARGWTPVAGPGKHRYVYLLGDRRRRADLRRRLLLPVLPYPKADGAD